MDELGELNDSWQFIINEHNNILSQIKDLKREDELVMQDIRDLMSEAKEKGFKLNNHTLTWE